MKKFKYIALTLLTLIIALSFAACDDGNNEKKLSQVTGFSFNEGFWHFNEVEGAQEYVITIQNISYTKTVNQSAAVNGEFLVEAGSIASGNHTAYIVAKAEGKVDSNPASCSANIVQATPQLSQVTGFSFNEGFWQFNEVEGAQEYVITIPEIEYLLTLNQNDADNGEFNVAAHGIGVGTYTAYIVAKAEGMADSQTTSCSVNVPDPFTYVPLEIQAAAFTNATKTVSFNEVENASGYTVELRKRNMGSWLTLPSEHIKISDNTVQALVDFTTVSQAYANVGDSITSSGLLDFRVSALGQTIETTVYQDAVRSFYSTYSIEKLSTPVIENSQGATWQTVTISFAKISNATGYGVLVDWDYTNATPTSGSTLDELGLTLTDEGSHMAFSLTTTSEISTSVSIKVCALSTTEGISNVMHTGSDTASQNVQFVKPADPENPKTHLDVFAALKTKAETFLESELGVQINAEFLIIKDLELHSGVAYFEFKHPVSAEILLGSCQINGWAGFSFANFEHIIDYINLHGFTDSSLQTEDTTWDLKRATMGLDYWSVVNIGAKAAIAAFMVRANEYVSLLIDEVSPIPGLTPSITLKVFDLATGKIYVEGNVLGLATVVVWADIVGWSTLNPQSYDDIIDYLQNTVELFDDADFTDPESNTNWEAYSASLDLSGVYNIYNLSGYLDSLS